MLKTAIKLFTFWIPVSSWRRRSRFFLKCLAHKGLIETLNQLLQNDNVFTSFNVRQNSILIVEPNAYHGEILPGFVKYFQELGFNVDLFLRHENIEDSPFVDIQGVNIFRGTAGHIKKMLKQKKISEYEFCFLSSSAYWDAPVNVSSYLGFLGFEPNAKNGIMMIEHNIGICLKEYGEEKYLEAGRLFTLSGLENTPMLNPHYFGEFEQVDKNEKVNFICVGAVLKECKNHDLLFSAASELIKNGLDFKITVIGGGRVIEIPEALKNYIEFRGRLPFELMYKEMQKSDFFLPLLDPTVEAHKKYLTGTTTGSKQLILGFLKPCLINEQFGKVYDFDNDNSILYKDNDLLESMKIAIEMNKEEYLKKQDNLKIMSDKIKETSLNNLKNSIKKINSPLERILI